MEELKHKLAQILEVDEVSDDQVLESFECWDSLTILSIIAFASKDYHKEINTEQIRQAATIKGLIGLIAK